jgi:hypothetical protein
MSLEEQTMRPRKTEFWNAEPTAVAEGESGELESRPGGSGGSAEGGREPSAMFVFVVPSLGYCTRSLEAFTTRMEAKKEQSDWGPMYAALVGPEGCAEIDGLAVVPGEWVCLVQLYPPFAVSVLEGVTSEMEKDFPLLDLIHPESIDVLQADFDNLFSSLDSSRHLVRLPLEEDEEFAPVLRKLKERSDRGRARGRTRQREGSVGEDA